MMHVRELQSDDDIWAVRELAIAHHAEFGLGRSFDSAAVVQSGIECRSQDVRYMNCWIAFNGEDKAVGYLAASSSRPYHTHRRVAVQDMWYVLPQYRGARAAIMLADAYEEWARWLGCEHAFMIVEHNELTEQTEKTSKLMDRLGFMRRGTMHIKSFTEEE